MNAIINKSKISNHLSISRMPFRIFSAVTALLLLVLLPSCYSSTAVKGIPVEDLVMAQDQRVLKKKITKEDKEVLALMSQVRSNKVFIENSEGVPEYRIGPLDVLEITSHVGDKAETATLTVNNQGRISYSFIDNLDVRDMTPNQLAEVLIQKLSAFIKKPRIDVVVKEFTSKGAIALGEIAGLRSSTSGRSNNGRITLTGKTTLVDLIALSGGYTLDADIKQTKLVREGKSYIINLYDILEKGDANQNVIIDDGDVVDIPLMPAVHERLYIMGEVNSPGIYSVKNAVDLLGAIVLAGNVTSLAKETNTIIVRGYSSPENAPLVMMADVKALLRNADVRQNITLEEGDLIYVPRMVIGDVNEWISNNSALLSFIFYPKTFQDTYFTKNYLHINSK